jgi:tRNA threonylcarbamoyl adenosine modification protein (Sua5/YciO/YrdC/YwlC family)
MAAVLRINPQNPQLRLIRRVIETLNDGGVIVYPTDTVYGFGCSIYAKGALERIFAIKRQDLTKPLSFICSDLKNIATYAQVSTPVFRALKHHLPGPYTFILSAAREVPKKLWSKRKTVGIRVPNHRIPLLIVRELGHPIISTSITDGDGNYINNPDVIEEKYGKLVDLIIDGGAQTSGPSSVIDMTGDAPVIVREGSGDLSWFR